MHILTLSFVDVRFMAYNKNPNYNNNNTNNTNAFPLAFGAPTAP
jgi:hypothetical protein